MKRIIILIVLFFLSLTLFGDGIILNNDKPIRGEWKFKPEKVWSIDSAGNEILVRLGKIDIDRDGNVYISEIKAGKIFAFDKTGKFLCSIGKKGEGPGEYKMVYSFYLFDDTIVVPDMGRFHYFKTNGKYIKTVNTGVSFMFPRAMKDKNILFYVKDEEDGKYKNELLSLFDLSNKKSRLIKKIVSKKPNVISSGGMTLMIKMDGKSVAYNNDSLFIGDSDKYIFEKIDLNGKTLMKFGIKGRKKIRVTEKMKRAKYNRVVFNGGKMPKDMVDKLIKNEPDFANYFDKLIFINNYYFVYLKNPDAEKNDYKFDVFDKDGKYIYRANFKLPAGMLMKTTPVFKGKFVYVFAEDEEGENSFIKYKVSLPR